MRLNSNSVFLVFLGFVISIPSLVHAGVGEDAILVYRVISGAGLIITTLYFAAFFAFKLRFFLNTFNSSNVISGLLLILCFYPLLRLGCSSNYEIPRLLGSLNFAILPPAALYFYKLLRYKVISISYRSATLLLGPSLIASFLVILKLNTQYLSLAWLAQAFGFILPVIVAAWPHRIVVFKYIYMPFVLISGLTYSSMSFSRTLIAGFLISLFTLFTASFSSSSLIVVLMIFVPFFVLSQLFLNDTVLMTPLLSFVQKNNSAYLNDSFLSSIGIADTRSGVFADFFSRPLQSLLIGNGSTEWFSSSMGLEGEYRGGIEGLYLNLSLEYGLVYGLLLIFLVVLSIISSLRSLFNALPRSSDSLTLLLPRRISMLGILPFSILAIFFFNPQPSFTLLILFVFIYDSLYVFH
jgi:hypothetical protein